MCKTLRQDLSSPKEEIKLVKKMRATKLQPQNALRKINNRGKPFIIFHGTKNLEFKEYNFNAQKDKRSNFNSNLPEKIFNILYLVFTLPL
jgi:hypothetical protein